MSAHARILYDSDCRFCRWTLAWVLRWDRRRSLEPVALRDGEAAGLLAGIAEDERTASWHLVDPGGGVASAGAAIAPLARLLPGGAPLAAVLGRFPGTVERAYRFAAGHRAAFGRRLTAGAIARADRVIDGRRPARRPPQPA